MFGKIENVKQIRTNNANKLINQTSLSVGDKVYLKLEARRKLDSVQEGPYIVIELDNANAIIKHEISTNILKVHKSRLIKHTDL